MRNGLTIPVLLIGAAGCGGLAGLDAQFDGVPFRGETVRSARGTEVALLLLAAKEGKDIGEMDAPAPEVEKGEKESKEPSGGAGGFVLRVGGGLALPGTGAIGSAGESAPKVPAYSDVWTSAGAFEVVGEFGAGKKLTPYAQLAVSQFAGQKWTNPSDSADTWLASGSSLTLLAGGVRFGGRFYGKAAAGLLLWPEVSRIAYATGYTEAILASGATGAVALGGGAEFSLGKLAAYLDAELVMAAAPEKAENAIVFWPGFAPAGMNSFKLAGGVGISF